MGLFGQCAVIAAKMRGASQIILMSRHEDRQQMALESGATAIVAERGEEGIARCVKFLAVEQMQHLSVLVLRRLLSRLWVSFIMAVVWELLVCLTIITVTLGSTFAQNISVAGGAASATTYDKQFLLKAVLDGDINPGRVFYFKL